MAGTIRNSQSSIVNSTSLPILPRFRLCSCTLYPFVPIRVNWWFILSLVSWWLCLNYAKRTQFPKPTNHHNLLHKQDLRRFFARPPSKKQSQSNPIPSTQYATRTTLREKQTQLVAAKPLAKPDSPVPPRFLQWTRTSVKLVPGASVPIGISENTIVWKMVVFGDRAVV